MRKGFTLIELLAVIVILAIIALIATPIVLNIIKDSRDSVGLRSAEMYLDAVEQAVSIEKMSNTNFNPNSCNITKEGNLYCEEYEDKIEVEVKGEKPINGNIKFEQGKIIDIILQYINDETIIKDDNNNLVYKEYNSINNYEHQHIDGSIENHEVTFDSNGHGICKKCKEEVLVAGLYDDYDKLLATWEELVNDYGLKLSNNYNDNVCKETEGSLYYVLNNNEKLKTGTKLIVGDSVKTIGSFSFSQSTIKEVIFPDSVTQIGTCVFQHCKNLQNIKLPKYITDIYNNVFINCISLKHVTIPNKVTSIHGYSFSGCSKLESIDIPKSVTKIVNFAFNGCPLKIINYDGTKSQWNSIEKDDYWNNGCPEITVHCTDGDIVIPQNK